LPLII